MILSPGFLHSSFSLLQLLEGYHVTAEDVIENVNRILVAAPRYVIDMSLCCGWVTIDGDGHLVLTKRGLDIKAEKNYEVRLCQQIKDFILHETPVWAALIPRGRQETLSFLPLDVRQCFFEAGLDKSPPSEHIVAWWDELSTVARYYKIDVLGKIGRDGERLSINYETIRLGQKPIWQSIESNLSGYDILSRKSKDDLIAPLMIEVKTSTEPIGTAKFHLTRNEWNTAVVAENYVFHLWLPGKQPKLAIVDRDQVIAHLPSENGCGLWESICIPFKCFENDFNFVKLN